MSDAEVDGELVDIDLRPVGVIAARCVIIAAMIRRQSINVSAPEDRHELTFDLREWLRAEGLWDLCTKREQASFALPAGSPGERDDDSLASLVEHIATLAWVLSLGDPFTDGTEFSIAEIIRSIPSPWGKTAPWIDARTLRSEAVIAVQRERTEIWHWRLEIEPFRRVSKGHELMEVEQAIREVTRDAVATGLLAPGKKGGFTFDGAPLTTADPFELEAFEFIMQERLMTLNWVCGHGENWDDVPLEI